MNVTTKPLDALLPVSSQGNSVPKAPSIQGGGFLDAVKQALATTSQLQSESGRLGREVAFGSPTVSLEETMLAGVKSNIAFQATLQSRNRIVQCLYRCDEYAGLMFRGGKSAIGGVEHTCF